MMPVLHDLIAEGWLDETKASDLVAAWPHNHPNAYYRLGLEPVPGIRDGMGCPLEEDHRR